MFKKKKIFLFIIIILVILGIALFINKKMTKNKKSVNNMNSQEIVDYILNINSYKANATVQINSNKNSNKYILKQEYNQNESIEEILEPSNIKGIKIINKEGNLIVENSNLNLSTIFENYQILEENYLDLSTFINECKESNNYKYEEENDSLIIKLKSNKDNKYIKNKILYINKSKAIPTKLVIEDDNKKIQVNIEYNEIELN